MKKTSIVFILIIIMIVGSTIRLYRLTDVPAGLLQDEAAMGYDVAGGILIKEIKNSLVSDYALYEKDGDLIVRFETKRSKSSKTRPDTVDYSVGIFSKIQL